MKKSAWYVFADGYEVWLNGMSRQEQRVLESKHGKIVEIYYDQTERRKPTAVQTPPFIFPWRIVRIFRRCVLVELSENSNDESLANCQNISTIKSLKKSVDK